MYLEIAKAACYCVGDHYGDAGHFGGVFSKGRYDRTRNVQKDLFLCLRGLDRDFDWFVGVFALTLSR